MNTPQQIDQISITRATNAAHYEYLATVKKRLAEIQIENELWKKSVDEFMRAFATEDKAFKRYSASLKTEPLRVADAERDHLYASLRDAVKAFAKFPIEEMSSAAEPLLRIVKNYKINTAENYMKESGNIDNLLQDMGAYSAELRKLQLTDVVSQLRTANDRVRQLIAERNVERGEMVLGELATARHVSDEAYAAVVMYTNAVALLTTDRREPADLVKRMQEDLDYFRRHAMKSTSRNRENNTNNIPVAQTDDDQSTSEK